jgi:hypothetical protein
MTYTINWASKAQKQNRANADEIVNILTIPKALLLACLFNNPRPNSPGAEVDVIRLKNKPMTVQEAEVLINERLNEAKSANSETLAYYEITKLYDQKVKAKGHSDGLVMPTPKKGYLRYVSDPLYFDYIKGKPIKTDIDGFEINVKAYNEIYGPNTVQNIVNAIYHAIATQNTDELDHNLTPIQKDEPPVKAKSIRSKM